METTMKKTSSPIVREYKIGDIWVYEKPGGQKEMDRR